MDVFAVTRAQRACRAFAPDDVPDGVIERLLSAATFAPSAENSQPWVFVVVRAARARHAIGELARRAWDGGARAYEEGRLAPALLADVDQGMSGGIAAAPVIVVVAGDTSRCPERALPSSVFPAVQNLLLAATAEGLGSALTTLPTVFAAELRELTGLPAHALPMAVVPLGRPARPLGPPRRAPVSERAFRERYGAPW